MLKLSPCLAAVVIALTSSLDGNLNAQSPTYPQTPQPYRYTIPVAPTDRDSAPLNAVQQTRLNAPVAGDVTDPFTIDSQGVISYDVKPATVKPIVKPQAGFSTAVTPTAANPAAADPAAGNLSAVNPATAYSSVAHPAVSAPDAAKTSATQSSRAEPVTVEPVGFAEHIRGKSTCDCSPLGPCKSSCQSCAGKPNCCAQQAGACSIGGWIQQGFTGNFNSPSNRSNAPVLFNDRANDYRLNQLYMFAERSVVPNRHDWDLGGRIDFLFGSDARFLTVPGLERHKDRTPKWNSERHDYGFAIPQAYVEVAAPWQNGVSLKAGHFYSIAGYETAAAPENFFYSHAYTFLYGEPFTHTGALLTGKRNKQLQWQLGYTNGWDVFDSLSDEYGILAGLTISTADQRTSLSTTVHSGKDVTSARSGGELVDGDRHFYSLVLQHKINKCWRYVFQHDFGYQQSGQIVVNTTPNTITSDTAKWYGINQYLIHDINDQMSSALRVEWFRDQDQSRIGIPVRFNPGGPAFEGGNYVAVTGGLNWRPQNNLTVRPELRWDYSDLKGNASAPGGDPSFRAFDDNTSSSQVTAALDVTLLF